MTSVFSTNSAAIPLPLFDIVARLLAAAGLSLLSLLCDRQTRQRGTASPHLAIAGSLIALIVTMVLMTVDNSLSRTFGAFAALSVVRFRMPVKDISDMVFLFLNIGIGIACGAGAYKVAACSVLFICALSGVLQYLRFSWLSRQDFLLKVVSAVAFEETQRKACEQAILRHAASFSIMEAGTVGTEGQELIYECRGLDGSALAALLEQVRGLPDVRRASLVSLLQVGEVE